MINVTKTFLPPQDEYNAILKQAWNNNWITNRGVLVKELEAKLKDYLDVSNIIATTNGTLPLQIAIKALGLTGEIITTPFSYVATTSSIVWEGCTPVFVDIHPDYLTIDETKIEAAINSNTTAILATHVFGNPCAVDVIEEIAKKYKLKVIYDAAHCFGVTYKGQSIFNYGDVSTCSFHGSKLFHTAEGGALFCKPEFFETMYYHHNFGHDGPDVIRGLGINAKMSELQAAMGLAILPYMASLLNQRKEAVFFYNEELKRLKIKTLNLRDEKGWNYSYYPVLFNSEIQLLQVKKSLEKRNIFPRRYFFPSLDSLSYVNDSDCFISKNTSKVVLCLPLWSGISKSEIDLICEIIKENI